MILFTGLKILMILFLAMDLLVGSVELVQGSGEGVVYLSGAGISLVFYLIIRGLEPRGREYLGS